MRPSWIDSSLEFKNIYIHLPFCEVHCHYCDFFVVPLRKANHKDLHSSILKEIELWRPSISSNIKTIYYGGGTPSETPSENIIALNDSLCSNLSEVEEISLEANPTSVTEENVKNWQLAGINRLSIGIQSLNDTVLKKLGRNHRREMALKAIEVATANFDRVCCDLIYGIPGSSIQDLAETIDRFVDAGLKHISAYTLTLDRSHFLYRNLPTPDESLRQGEYILEKLEAAGFRHYEASNFALPGFESVHNRNYWDGNSYLGLGPSAHSFDGRNVRWINWRNLNNYNELLKDRHFPIESHEKLSLDQLEIEFFMTQLRRVQGFSLDIYCQRFGTEKLAKLRENLAEMEQLGYGQVIENTWNPSFLGIMLSDTICEKLI